ncbi:MAG: MscL family protein [Patescibacteria group bacterium]
MENKNDQTEINENKEVSSSQKKFNSQFLKGLLDFLKEYSVIGLAIGVIIGQTSKDLVDSLVEGFFMPIVELLVSKEKFESLVFILKGVSFDIGSILSSLITFLIIMTFLYFIVKKIIKNDKFLPKKKL